MQKSMFSGLPEASVCIVVAVVRLPLISVTTEYFATASILTHLRLWATVCIVVAVVCLTLCGWVVQGSQAGPEG